MKYFIALLFLFVSLSAHAAQTCDRGYYKPSPDAECTRCPGGYYCPDDDSDDRFPCPPDNTNWNTLLEECGYHPLNKIATNELSSWADMVDGVGGQPAYLITQCVAENDQIKLQEGLMRIEHSYVINRGDYWNGCDGLNKFHSANPGYYLSEYIWSNVVHDFYHSIKPCTNTHPENSHYSGPGTPDEPVKTGGRTDYNDCPWECDDGYGRHNDECRPLCTAGATKFHVGDYVFNIYKEKLTTPAINIGFGDGTVCYVPLVEGSGKGALNVDYHGTVYHTSD